MFFLLPTSEAPEPEQEITAQEVIATTTPEVIVEIPKPVEVKPVVLDTDASVEMAARIGADHPLMRVAKCESGLRQFNRDGSVLRGKQNSQDVGILQVNERYHLAESKRLGYDIHTLVGNIDYGMYLYEKQGLKPWNWSKHCWSPM